MILDIKCKKCRKINEKLFLKGERCYSPKCPLIKIKANLLKRGGKTQGRRPKNKSEFGRQLSEKQKVKLYYGITERQLKKYYKEATKKRGSTPENLAKRLEQRLDSVILASGFASSHTAARQLTTHGHFSLNGKRHDVPSSEIKINDIIALSALSLKKPIFNNLKEKLEKHQTPAWLKVDLSNLTIQLVGEPDLQELSLPFNFSLIVEFYSR